MKHLRLSSDHYSQYLVTGILSSFGAIAISLTNFAPATSAQVRNPAVYKPTTITTGVDINDILTDRDIPTGQKGFARDYILEAQKDERLEITVSSESFDTVLSLLDAKGDIIAENDDAASDTTNSLIFFKVRQSGSYTIRVSSFGGSSGGKFTLKVTKLRIVN